MSCESHEIYERAIARVAIERFMMADTSIELDDAFDVLMGLGLDEMTITHTSENGITFISSLPIPALYTLFREAFIDQEAEALQLAREEGSL